MKSKFIVTSTLASWILTLALMATVNADQAQKPKKEKLHFHAQEEMANLEVLPEATGKVTIYINQQSKSNPRRMKIDIKDLEPNAAYQLVALIGEDTSVTNIAEFTANREGKAKVEFRTKTSGKANKHPFPDAFWPMSNINELSVLDSSAQTVLSCDLNSPDKLECYLKRDVSTDTVEAKLHIKAKVSKAELKVDLSGLAPDTEYSLVLNGAVAQTESSDDHGKLKLEFELDNPLDILALESLAIQTTADAAIVVSTTLP